MYLMLTLSSPVYQVEMICPALLCRPMSTELPRWLSWQSARSREQSVVGLNPTQAANFSLEKKKTSSGELICFALFSRLEVSYFHNHRHTALNARLRMPYRVNTTEAAWLDWANHMHQFMTASNLWTVAV